MKVFERAMLGVVVSVLVAIPICPSVARGDDDWEDRWEDRWEDYQEELEDRREALEEYWKYQRETQRELAYRRGHAWYGYYGPYYGNRVSPNYRTYGPSQYFAPGPAPVYYEYAPGLPCRRNGYNDPGIGCHGGVYGGSLSIGPIRVFWE